MPATHQTLKCDERKRNLTTDDLKLYMQYPHVLGHVLGYPDLIPLHSEWIVNAWLNNKSFAMQAHRNSYKTTAIIVVGCVWYLLFYDPNATILIIRKAEQDAQKIVQTIQSHFLNPVIQFLGKLLYKCDTLQSEQWSRSSLRLSIKTTPSPEGNVEAKGTSSAVVGSHYDFIFPDDIITIRDRVSKAERDWTKLFVNELSNIKKEGGKIFFSGTPWHPDDAWKNIPEPKKYPIGSVDIPGFTQDVIQNKIKELKQSNSVSLFSANYELSHIADIDRLFGEPDYAPWPESSSQIIAYLDPAYSGDNHTALAMGARLDASIVVCGWVWRQDVTELYDVIVNILNDYKCGTLYVETNADKGLSVRDFQKKYPSVIGRNESQNKHIKIVSFVKNNWTKIKFSDTINNDFLMQVMEYQEGQEPDDGVDALSGLCREMGLSGSTELRMRYI